MSKQELYNLAVLIISIIDENEELKMKNSELKEELQRKNGVVEDREKVLNKMGSSILKLGGNGNDDND